MSRQRQIEPEVVALALERAAATIEPLDRDAVWLVLERRLDAATARVRHLPLRRVTESPRRRLVVHGLVAVAAAFVALAAISMRAVPGSPLYSLRRGIEETALILSPNDAGLHVGIASARLDDLVLTLEQGPIDASPDLARALVSERAAAVAAGAGVSELDRAIATEVPPALAAAPAEVASEVRAILGSLLPPVISPPPPGGGDSSGEDSTNGGANGAGAAVGPQGGSSSHGSSDGSGSGTTEGDSTGSSSESTTDAGDGSDQGSGDSQDSGSGDSQSSGSNDSQSSGSNDSQGSGTDHSDSSPSPDPSPTCDPSSCDSGGD